MTQNLWAISSHSNNYFNLNRRCVYLIELSRMILGKRKITKAFFRRSRFLFSIIRVGRHNDILAVANVTLSLYSLDFHIRTLPTPKLREKTGTVRYYLRWTTVRPTVWYGVRYMVECSNRTFEKKGWKRKKGMVLWSS